MKTNNSLEEIFSEIYENSLWGVSLDGGKFCSGTGTLDTNTEKYIIVLKDFINCNQIKKIFEIGCGDFTIMNSVLEQSNVNYVGVDVVKKLINYLLSKYGTKSIGFEQMDATCSKKIPVADLCIIRQVFQHLTNDQTAIILRKTKQFKYVIITEHVPLFPMCKNGDKVADGYIRLQNHEVSGIFLDAAPFSLNCKTILSYRLDDMDYNGNKIPAIVQTILIENNTC